MAPSDDGFELGAQPLSIVDSPLHEEYKSPPDVADSFTRPTATETQFASSRQSQTKCPDEPDDGEPDDEEAALPPVDTTQYLTGFPLTGVVSGFTMAAFLLMIDSTILVTVGLMKETAEIEKSRLIRVR